MPISSRSSWPLIEVPWTPEPTWARRIVPRSAIQSGLVRSVGMIESDR
jgi:hypothetical protein